MCVCVCVCVRVCVCVCVCACALVAHFSPALQWFEAPEALTPETDPEQRIQVLKYRAELAFCRGRHQEALRSADELRGQHQNPRLFPQAKTLRQQT